ncbi:MAG: hypothetical protein V3V05_02935 [Pontiella sp.]
MKVQQMKKIGAMLLTACVATGTLAADEDRIQALEKQMTAANAEIASLKGEQNDLSVIGEQESKLTLGGYGEIHANFVEGGNDQIDIHRLVMYVGYEFADWIRLSSEVELEHAFVADSDGGDNGGEISIEQLYVDFLLSDPVNVRAGRVLAPIGIINQNHEPTLFLGVERPNFSKNIIPSTWSLDGIGVFGFPTSWLSYEAYVVAGLDNAGFSASSGVRGGRIKERGGLNDGAFTGRLDFFPFVDADLPADQDVRVGVSGYYGGTNNKNKGGDSSSGVDNTFSLASVDFEYDISRLLFRGVIALGENSDADKLTAGVGEQVFGWYLESGIKALPQSWKKGKLAEAELIPFVRYEKYDTQHKLPGGVPAATGANDRTEITVGANFLLTSQFVLKADVQFASNELAGSGTVTKYNLGMGWVFN